MMIMVRRSVRGRQWTGIEWKEGYCRVINYRCVISCKCVTNCKYVVN